MEYIMKLDPKTISILNNFSNISPSILFREGNVITTVSPAKTIMAKAVVPNSFDKRFAVYNLSRFIGTVSLFENPSLTFQEKSVNISGDENRSVNYYYADENTIKAAPEKEIVLPSVDIEFKLTDKSLKEVMRGAGVLGLPDIAVVGDGTNVKFQALDSKLSDGDVYSVNVGTTDKNFRLIFKVENFIKIMAADYDVKISSKGISHLKSNDIEYWIALESSSSYDA
jgi:hypothetical protein